MATVLASTYARQGLRVCLVDLDPQGTATHVLKGADVTSGKELGERLQKGRSITDLIASSPINNLSLVPTSDALTVYESLILADPIGVTKVAKSLDSLGDTDAQIVIVDTPPSLGPFTFGSLLAASWALIPTLCDDSSIRTLPSALRTVSETRAANPRLRVLAIVANRLERATRHGATGLQTLQAAFPTHLAQTVLPKAAAIADALRPGFPLDERSSAAAVILELAEELVERMTEGPHLAENETEEEPAKLVGNS